MRSDPPEAAPKLSAIVATYNWPEALELVLDSLARQTYANYEVIVADDGSGPATKAVIDRLSETFPVPLIHSWQEDMGYRLSRSRNLAVTRSSGDYLIMLDGDSMLFPTFLENHARHAEAGWFTAGRRCFMRKWASAEILRHKRQIYRWPRALLFPLALFGGSNRPTQLITFPFSDERRRNRATEWNKAQGCNLGIWRSDFETVGGFEEDFEGYGLEDTDLVVRLFRAGVRRKTLEHLDPVLHLWHGRRKTGAENRARLENVLNSDAVRADCSALYETSDPA